MVAKAEAIRIGDPFEWTTQMGAINSQAHLSKIENYVEIGNAEGAQLVAGGKRPAGAGFQKGFWFQPTVFADVRQDMRIAREEISAPCSQFCAGRMWMTRSRWPIQSSTG